MSNESITEREELFDASTEDIIENEKMLLIGICRL